MNIQPPDPVCMFCDDWCSGTCEGACEQRENARKDEQIANLTAWRDQLTMDLKLACNLATQRGKGEP